MDRERKPGALTIAPAGLPDDLSDTVSVDMSQGHEAAGAADSYRPTNVLRMDIRFAAISHDKADLELSAHFGEHSLPTERFRLGRHRIGSYSILFGVTGGELVVRLQGCVAPIEGRLGGGGVALSVSETWKQESDEATKIVASDEGKLEAKFDKGFSMSAGVGGKVESSQESRRHDGVERTYERILVYAAGDDDLPVWRFSSTSPVTLLIGPAGGAGPEPKEKALAKLQVVEASMAAQAAFLIRAGHLHITSIDRNCFGGRRSIKHAVARHALERLLRRSLQAVRGGRLMLAGASASAAKPASVLAEHTSSQGH